MASDLKGPAVICILTKIKPKVQFPEEKKTAIPCDVQVRNNEIISPVAIQADSFKQDRGRPFRKSGQDQFDN